MLEYIVASAMLKMGANLMTISELKHQLRTLNQQEQLSLIRWLLDNMVHTEESSQPHDTNNAPDFFTYAGIWANRDVDLTSIRKDAWPQRSR